MAVEDKFYNNLNQNLWGLIVSYTALGISEHWGLKRLGWLPLCVNRVKHFGPVHCRVLHVELLSRKSQALNPRRRWHQCQRNWPRKS